MIRCGGWDGSKQNDRKQNTLLRFALVAWLKVAWLKVAWLKVARRKVAPMKTALLNLVWLAAVCGLAEGQVGVPRAAPAGSASDSVLVKQLGSIREIHGAGLLLATDQGGEVEVKVQPGARLLRLSPGQTDLKNAATIQLSDLQVGDRVLVRGKLGADGVGLEAASVLVMKQGEIAQRKREEMLDWQRRGVGGLVRQVDAQAGTVTLSLAGSSRTGASRTGPAQTGSPEIGSPQIGSATGQTVVVRATPKTTYRRYSPDSVKWEEATASQLGEIHVGDQLRAKGNRSADGSQVEAEEMVFGTFRNIAGLIVSIDSAKGTLTVDDVAAKKPITVQVTADSQMRKLPPQVAQGLARRLRGEGEPEVGQAGADQAGKEQATTNHAAPNHAAPNHVAPNHATTDHSTTSAPDARARGGDLNQMLARLPAATLTELQKGEAVMVVSTAGSAGHLPHAIILLGGAEPILRADHGGRSTEWLLTPWSLAAAPGGDQP